jgi:sugar phosphate isomerase/epimerase
MHATPATVCESCFGAARLMARRGPKTRQGSPELDIAIAHLCDVPGEQYNQLRDRYRDMARMLGFEGHIAWGEAMP